MVTTNPVRTSVRCRNRRAPALRDLTRLNQEFFVRLCEQPVGGRSGPRGTFEGGWARDRRAEHILARAGFVHALWARSDRDVTMYRGVGLGDAAAHPDGGGGRKMPLVSASFSRRVAESHFGSAGAAAGALYRQRLQPGRLFMTFLETGAMTRQYREAEAVLLRGSGPFF
jgi:hypothetical protein